MNNEQRALSGPGVQPHRFRADFPPGSVVFMIGMRVNELRRVDQWLPVFRAMPKMIRELMRQPELGLLGAENWGGGGRRWRCSTGRISTT